MATISCPKCHATLRRGSWEIFTNCPSCEAEWTVDPKETDKIRQRIVASAALYSVLSFVPVLGLFFGMVGTFWGFMAVRINRVVLGIGAVVVSTLVGIVCQPALTWWGIGHVADTRCRHSLTALSNSIYAYRTMTHQYPTLRTLIDMRFPVPTNCPSGGGQYFYFYPNQPDEPSTNGVASSSDTSNTAAVLEAASSAAAVPPPVVPAVEGPPPPLEGDADTLLVAELLPAHRTLHMFMTTDLTVHGLPHKEFQSLLKQPRNARFAAAFDKAYNIATAPKPKPGKPAASNAQASTNKTATADKGSSHK